MDAHLVHVPGLGTLTTGCLSGRDLESLGGQADGSLDAQLLGLCTLQELRAHLLERLHFARGQGDANLVDFLFTVVALVFSFLFFSSSSRAP